MASRGIAGVFVLVIMTMAFGVLVTVPRASASPAPQTPTAPAATTDLGWTPPTPLEAQSISNANLGGVALGGDGNGTVVWEKDGPRNTIMATRFMPGRGDAGTDWVVPVIISTGDCNNFAPAVAMDGAGRAMAVWYDNCNYAIHASLFQPGVGWSVPVGIDQPYWLSFSPQVAMNSAGVAFVTWEAWDGARDRVLANRYVPGTGWGTATLLDSTTNATYSANVAVDGAGDAIVTWYRWDGTIYHVLAARFDATTAGWGTPAILETPTNWAVYPTVSMDRLGNGIVAWIEWDGAYSVWASRYDHATGWGTAVSIESQTSWAFVQPPHVSANNGSAVVVWTMNGPGSDPYSVWANRYTAGTGWGTEADIDGFSGASYQANYASVALDRFGNASIVYQVIFVGSNPPGLAQIYGVRYSALTGAVSGYQALDWSRVQPGAPLIAMDPAGNGLAAWDFNEKTATNPVNGILTNRYTFGSGWRWYGPQQAEWDENVQPGWLQLESNAAGDAIFSWTQDDGPIWNGYAALYTPGHGWGSATRIEYTSLSSVQEEWSAIDPNGNAIVLVRVYNGVKYGVDAIYYSVTTGWGSPVRISDDTLSPTDVYDNYWLRIAMDAHGDGLAVWEGWNGTRENVYADWFSGTTHTWGGPAMVPSPVSVSSAVVGLDGNGDAVVAWQAWDGSTYSVYASEYTQASGWSAGALIEHNAMWADSPYAVAMNNNGDAALSWRYWNGTHWNAAVNTYTPGSGWGTETILSNGPGNGYPAIPSLDGAGDAMLAYQLWDGSQWDVYAATRPAGALWMAPVKLNAGTGDAVQITTALDYHGNGYAAWTQYNGYGYDILSRRYIAGQGWLPVNVVSSPAPATPATDTGSPILGVDGHGDAILGWNQWQNSALVPYAAEYIVGSGSPNLHVAAPADGTLTRTKAVTVSGTTDPGATVTIDGASVSVAANGSFSASYTLADGSHTFDVVATDAAGLTATVTRTVTVDTTPPAISITAPSAGLLTRNPVVQVTGTTEPGATVIVDGVEAAVSASGQFSVAIALREGTNTVTAAAMDAAGNTAQTSVTVDLDTTAPAIAITSPTAGANLSSPTVTVTGTTEPGATVMVDGRMASVDASGSFSIQLTLSDGANLVTATATDAAGNTGSTQVVLTYTNPAPGAQLQSRLSSLDMMNLILIVLVVVALGLAGFEMIQIRRLRGEKPPQQKPEGGSPPSGEL